MLIFKGEQCSHAALKEILFSDELCTWYWSYEVILCRDNMVYIPCEIPTDASVPIVSHA